MNEIAAGEQKLANNLLNSRTEIEGLTRLVKASLYKDDDTGVHTSRVAFMSIELARLIGLEDSFALSIFYASALHDVGKIAIPDSILKKKGKLTPAEWCVMRQHSQKGTDFFEEGTSNITQACYNVSLYHHENYDGTGYPFGLKGTEIPIEARIVSIIDVYDALTMKRCYRPALSHSQAIDLMSSEMSAKFDPGILNAFLKNTSNFETIKKIIDKNGPIDSLYEFYG